MFTIAKVGADKKIASATTYGNDLELIAQLDPKSLPKPPAAKTADKPATGATAPAKPATPATPAKPAAPATPPAKK